MLCPLYARSVWSRGIARAISILLVGFALSACSASGKSADAPVCSAKTEACRELNLVAKQTHEYEEAGASQRDAACLAAVTGRFRAPKSKGTSVVLVTGAQSRAIGRCRISEKTFAKIGAWARAHYPIDTTPEPTRAEP
jgi:hypothetical protein